MNSRPFLHQHRQYMQFSFLTIVALGVALKSYY